MKGKNEIQGKEEHLAKKLRNTDLNTNPLVRRRARPAVGMKPRCRPPRPRSPVTFLLSQDAVLEAADPGRASCFDRLVGGSPDLEEAIVPGLRSCF